MRWIFSHNKFKLPFQRLLLCLLGLGLFLLIMFQGGAVSYFLFYSIMPIFLYTLVLHIYPIQRTVINQTVEQFNQNQNNLLITLDMSFPIPLLFMFIKVHHHYPKRLGAFRKTIRFPILKRSVRIQEMIEDVPRGEYEFTQVSVEFSDLFGFLKRQNTYSVSNKILVYPSYRKIKLIEETYHSEAGSHFSQMTPKNQQYVIGNREYQRGDRFSWIDWKASARRQELITKEFSDAFDNHFNILLDCKTSPHFEACVSTVMSIVMAAHQWGVPFSFIAYGSKRIYHTYPENPSVAERNHLYRELSVITDDSYLPFYETIQGYIKDGCGKYSTYFITHQVTTLEMNEMLKLNRRQNVRLYYIYDGRGAISKETNDRLITCKKQGMKIQTVSYIDNHIVQIEER